MRAPDPKWERSRLHPSTMDVQRHQTSGLKTGPNLLVFLTKQLGKPHRAPNRQFRESAPARAARARGGRGRRRKQTPGCNGPDRARSGPQGRVHRLTRKGADFRRVFRRKRMWRPFGHGNAKERVNEIVCPRGRRPANLGPDRLGPVREGRQEAPDAYCEGI